MPITVFTHRTKKTGEIYETKKTGEIYDTRDWNLAGREKQTGLAIILNRGNRAKIKHLVVI